MQVQSIQANQTTNNCRKPCFKAHFLNDTKGMFKNLWETASKDYSVREQIATLAGKENHALEILSVEKEPTYCYKIFNHFTGKFKNINIGKNAGTMQNALYLLLRKINDDEEFFRDDENSRSYRLLTGQGTLRRTRTPIIPR